MYCILQFASPFDCVLHSICRSFVGGYPCAAYRSTRCEIRGTWYTLIFNENSCEIEGFVETHLCTLCAVCHTSIVARTAGLRWPHDAGYTFRAWGGHKNAEAAEFTERVFTAVADSDSLLELGRVAALLHYARSCPLAVRTRYQYITRRRYFFSRSVNYKRALPFLTFCALR